MIEVEKFGTRGREFIRKIDESKKSSSLTQDFNILPSKDHIKGLIKQDASEYADKIKDQLFKKIEDGRGQAHIEYDIPVISKDLVVEELDKWAGLHDYKCTVDGNNILLSLKGIKREPIKVCSNCGRRSKTFTRFLIGFSGTAVAACATALGIVFVTHPASIIGCIFGGMLAFVVSISAASEW